MVMGMDDKTGLDGRTFNGSSNGLLIKLRIMNFLLNVHGTKLHALEGHSNISDDNDAERQ